MMAFRNVRSDRKSRRGASLAGAVVLLFAAPAAYAQMSQDSWYALPSPGSADFPASRWANVDSQRVNLPGQSTISETYHDYARVPSNGGESQNPDNVQYVLLEASACDSDVSIVPYWTDPIADPSATGDNCYHSHFSTALYYDVTFFSGGGWHDAYPVAGTEGRVGRRMGFVNGQVQEVERNTPNAWCSVSSDPVKFYEITQAQYVWKDNPQNFEHFIYTCSPGRYYVGPTFVAMQSATHGWGDCGNFQCFPGVGLIAWAN